MLKDEEEMPLAQNEYGLEEDTEPSFDDGSGSGGKGAVQMSGASSRKDVSSKA
jgi:hypothetical protein